MQRSYYKGMLFIIVILISCFLIPGNMQKVDAEEKESIFDILDTGFTTGDSDLIKYAKDVIGKMGPEYAGDFIVALKDKGKGSLTRAFIKQKLKSFKGVTGIEQLDTILEDEEQTEDLLDSAKESIGSLMSSFSKDKATETLSEGTDAGGLLETAKDTVGSLISSSATDKATEILSGETATGGLLETAKDTVGSLISSSATDKATEILSGGTDVGGLVDTAKDAVSSLLNSDSDESETSETDEEEVVEEDDSYTEEGSLVCKPASISTEPSKKLSLYKGENVSVLVKVLCSDGNPAIDVNVVAHIKKNDARVDLDSKNATTDENGEAIFTIYAIKSTKKKPALMNFKAGDLKAKLHVRIKKEK